MSFGSSQQAWVRGRYLTSWCLYTFNQVSLSPPVLTLSIDRYSITLALWIVVAGKRTTIMCLLLLVWHVDSMTMSAIHIAIEHCLWCGECICCKCPSLFPVFSRRDGSYHYSPSVGIHSQPFHSRDNIWALVLAPPPGLCSKLLLTEYFCYYLHNFLTTFPILTSYCLGIWWLSLCKRWSFICQQAALGQCHDVLWSSLSSVRLINGNDKWLLLKSFAVPIIGNFRIGMVTFSSEPWFEPEPSRTWPWFGPRFVPREEPNRWSG